MTDRKSLRQDLIDVLRQAFIVNWTIANLTKKDVDILLAQLQVRAL